MIRLDETPLIMGKLRGLATWNECFLAAYILGQEPKRGEAVRISHTEIAADVGLAPSTIASCISSLKRLKLLALIPGSDAGFICDGLVALFSGNYLSPTISEQSTTSLPRLKASKPSTQKKATVAINSQTGEFFNFESMMAAAKAVGVSKAAISAACAGIVKVAYGYRWYTLEDYETMGDFRKVETIETNDEFKIKVFTEMTAALKKENDEMEARLSTVP